MSDDYLEFLQAQSGPNIDLVALQELLEVTNKELASILGVHRSLIGKSPSSPKAQANSRKVIQVLSILREKFGKDNYMLYFNNLPLPTLWFLTPRQALEGGINTMDIFRAVDLFPVKEGK